MLQGVRNIVVYNCTPTLISLHTEELVVLKSDGRYCNDERSGSNDGAPEGNLVQCFGQGTR